MKKIVYGSLLFAGISAVFGLCYYLSFKNALIHYNREAVEQNTRVLQEILQSSGENERLLQQLMQQNEEVISAAAAGETLRENASYFLETVFLRNQTEEREQLALPGFMIGIDLKGITAYLKGYMETMPVNEYLAGLVSFEVVSFAQDKVVLRKTYDENKVENQFYVCRKGDFIVVYYSDLKNIYEYTDIRVDSLNIEAREVINQGFYVKNVQELYSILEGYTS